MRLPSPALVVAGLALFVALGGTVYAAKKARVDGKTVKVKSLPGNRLKLRSIPANRLKPSVLKGVLAAQSGPITGAEIDELTLGQVPEALQLAAFSQQPGVVLDSGKEWTSDLTNMTGPNEYAVVTVSPAGVIDFTVSSSAHKYRCVIPLLR